MTPLGGYIKSLLFHHDCVVVPGLGGFIANYQPAYTNSQGNKIFPPSKSLSFNRNLMVNDGLLAHHISNKANVSYQQALADIKNYTQKIRNALHQGKRVELEGLGFFFLDQEDNLQFVPVYRDNFLKDSFGLKPIYLKPVISNAAKKAEKQPGKEAAPPVIPIKQEEKTVEEKEQSGKIKESKEKTPIQPSDNAPKKVISIQEQAVNQQPTGPHHNGKKRKNLKYYLAAACLLPIAFYSLWIPLKTDAIQTGSLHISDFNPFGSSENSVKVYEVRKAETPLNEKVSTTHQAEKLKVDHSGKTVVNLGEDTKIKMHIRESLPTEQPSPKVEKTPEVEPYYIIAGCFSKKSNARRMVKELVNSGYEASIIDYHGGLHRVAFGNYTNAEAVHSALTNIRSDGHPSAWILKK